jgi:biopolymer transport protein ExbD
MQRRVLLFALLSSLAAFAVLVACGQEQPAPTQAAPIVSAVNLPISRNHLAPEPSNSVRIETTAEELRLNGEKVLDLTGGRVADAELGDNVITKLRTRIGSAPARGSAALWINATTPYATLAQVLKTVEAAGLREINFAVRRGMNNEIGWMKLTRWRVAPAGEDFVQFTERPLPWTAFTEHWHDCYEACREAGVERYINCDATLTRVAEGGNLQVQLWTRGTGMKVTFLRVPPPEEPAAEGEPPPPPQQEKAYRPPPGGFALPPATEGAFNFRQQEAVDDESAIGETVRPVCGAQSCQVVVEADATGASMRVLSLIGAAFPNGFSEPEIAFRLPAGR